MADFLLIHGAWHGAWCWKKLVPELQKAGHQVSSRSYEEVESVAK